METVTEQKTETIEIKELKNKKIVYSERETRLVIAWCLITFAISWFGWWAIATTGNARPPYIIDLLMPAMFAIVGVYMLRRKIPET